MASKSASRRASAAWASSNVLWVLRRVDSTGPKRRAADALDSHWPLRFGRASSWCARLGSPRERRGRWWRRRVGDRRACGGLLSYRGRREPTLPLQ